MHAWFSNSERRMCQTSMKQFCKQSIMTSIGRSVRQLRRPRLDALRKASCRDSQLMGAVRYVLRGAGSVDALLAQWSQSAGLK